MEIHMAGLSWDVRVGDFLGSQVLVPEQIEKGSGVTVGLSLSRGLGQGDRQAAGQHHWEEPKLQWMSPVT